MKNKIMLILLIFVLSSVGVYGAFVPSGYYTTFNDDYIRFNNGYFNENMQTDIINIRNLNPLGYSLIDELINNNTYIISVENTPRVIIYDDISMTEIASLSITCSQFLDLSTYDFEGDNQKEIILKCKNRNIVMSFDGENLTSTLDESLSVPDSYGNYLGSTNCENGLCYGLRVKGKSFTFGSNSGIYSYVFNKTDLIYDSGIKTDIMCLSNVANPRDTILKSYLYDITGDGNTDLITGFPFQCNSGDLNRYAIFIFNKTTSNLTYLSQAQIYSDNNAYDYQGTGIYMSNLASIGGDEIALAYTTSQDKYKMYLYSTTNAVIDEVDDFPEFSNGEGSRFSNIVRMNAFPSSVNNEFCVLSYDYNDVYAHEFALTCGNKLDNYAFETKTFLYYCDGLCAWNDYYTLFITPTSQKESNGNDEISSPIGIMELNYIDNNGWFNYSEELELLYSYGDDEQRFSLTVDIDGDELTEVFYQDDDYLYLVDDGYSNKYGYINSDNGYTFVNPCLDSIWKLNTTVVIGIQDSDYEDDNVCAKATLYYGDANQQNGSFKCGASDSKFIFDEFSLNKTGNNFKILLEGYDIENPTEIQQEEYLFSVSSNGVEYNDCIYYPNISPQEGSGVTSNDTGVELGTNTTPQDNNIVSTQIQSLTNSSGLGTTVIWLLIMGIVALFIFYESGKLNFDTNTSILILGVMEIILLIVGVKLQFISSAIIWTLVALGLIIGAIYSSRFFMGSRGM